MTVDNSTVSALPSHQQQLLRPYLEWHLLRRVRRRATHRSYTRGAANSDRNRITVTIDFLTWLDAIEIRASDLTQGHLDTWFDSNPSKRQPLVGFLVWLKQRKLVCDIEIPRNKTGLPQQFQDVDDHEQQLRRCLTDDTLPLDIRVVGALVRLYALPLVRIVALTIDRFRRDDTGAYLVVDRNPVILPPSLANLIEQWISQTYSGTTVSDSGTHPSFLLPGRPPSRPRHTRPLSVSLAEHGLPTIAARNTAMIANVADLHPAVVSELFGIHPRTAHKWAQYAQTSWADYLGCR